MASDLPSPTKRATMNPTPLAPSDPNDIRGSMQKQAQTGFEDMIAWKATQARRAVAQGHNLPNFLNTRRPLGPSRTEPTLSFAPSASLNSQNPPTRFPPFQTDREIRNLVFTDGKRPDELRPFGDTGSDYGGGSRTNSRTASGGLFGTSASTSMDEDGEDGFSMDEVFGKSSVNFKLPSSSQGDSQDSTRTVTQRMKRTYEGEDSATTLVGEGGEAEAEDDDMEETDVEDEGEDQVAPTLTNMFGQKTVGSFGERKIAGSKRAFGKTKSLPASAFTGGMEF
ncbi:hypothetical protein JCM3765_001589 [Sporobolomyces pararoseus]